MLFRVLLIRATTSLSVCVSISSVDESLSRRSRISDTECQRVCIHRGILNAEIVTESECTSRKLQKLDYTTDL